MKRLSLLAILCLLLISAFSVWAIDDDLREHADQFPLDTVMYFSTRIDDDTIASLDALVAKIGTFFPMIPSGMNLSFALENFADDQLNTDFADIQAWLGDTISVGIPLSEMNSRAVDLPAYIVVDLADAEAAFEFFNEQVADRDLEFKEIDGNQVMEFNGNTMVISKEYLLIAPTELLNTRDKSSLLDNPAFADALGRLPADDYGAVIYADYGAINRANLAMMGDNMPMPGMMEFMNSIATANVSMGMGFTILDESNLVIDIATTAYDIDYAQFGMQTLIPDPVDPDFVKNIPADASFVLHSTNLGSYLKLSLANIEAIGDYFLSQGGLGSMFDSEMMTINDEGKIFLDTFDLGTIAAGARYLFSGFTGMSLDDELTWMDGDLVLFMRVLPNENTIALPDFAMLLESTESGAPNTFIENFVDALTASDISFEQETIGDSSAVIFSQLSIESGLLDPALDILFAGNAEHLAVGQRTGVAEVITGVEDSLADDPTYQYASQYFLPDAQQVWYFGLPALREFVDTTLADYLRKQDSLRTMQDLEQLRAMMALIDSGSITAVAGEGNAINLRLVLSLGDEPPAPLSR